MPVQQRGLRWKEQILRWKIGRTRLYSRTFFLRLKSFCRCLLALGCPDSSPLRLIQRADDVDVFRKRWVDLIGGSLKRSDGAADRVQTIDNRQ